MHKNHNVIPFSLVEVLHSRGFRVTSSRIKLLELLKQVGRPLTIQSILAIWVGVKPNETTLYRSLSDLSEARIVKRLDLNTGTAHYEYTPDRPHHHQVVCLECGVVEEIERCSVGSLQKKIEKESSLFKIIEAHNLEFYGHCLSCSPN